MLATGGRCRTFTFFPSKANPGVTELYAGLATKAIHPSQAQSCILRHRSSNPHFIASVPTRRRGGRRIRRFDARRKPAGTARPAFDRMRENNGRPIPRGHTPCCS
jgi:hypothetical protein